MPGARVRSVALVIGAALLTAASAQLVIPLWFSPVPISGQTFAVLLTAAALGPLRAVAAQGLYLGLGAVGLPFFAGGESGVQVFAGSTGGYLVGFVVAAWVVGALARRGLDRTPHGTFVAFAAGSLVIYAFGLAWLAVVTGGTLGQVLAWGLTPFLIGDALKALLAAGLLPIAWRLTR